MGRLIIELLRSHGHNVERRYVFDNGHITIGRSYSNDIILDDPFVSPQHLSVSGNGGTLHVTDLSSENGTKVNGGPPLNDQAGRIESGDEIFIGKTKLKLLLADHPVEPARRMDKFMAMRQLLDRRSVAFVFTLLVSGLYVWMSYLEQPSEKFWKSGFFEMILGYVVAALIYTGLVGFIINVKFNKAYFKRHLAAFNAGLLISLIYSTFGPFLYFWITHNGLVIIANHAINFGVLAAMFWASLRLTKDVPKWGDIVRPTVVALSLVLLTAWGANEIRVEFSGRPSYTTRLAPYLKPLSQPIGLDSFLQNSGRELFESTD